MPEQTAAQPAGLYIHIPFCRQKCRYCDFYSVSNLSLKTRFIKALRSELQMVAAARSKMAFDTLYIGGGTPSLLGPSAIADIIAAAREAFTFFPDSETTIEINPGTVVCQDLNDLRRAGVNRINIGVQSFRDDNLRFLGRIHTAAEADRVLKWAGSAGFHDVGIDLIYGIPGQTLTHWRHDLERAVALAPAHVSCYALTYEPGTPLEKDLRQGRIIPIDEDRVVEMYRTGMKLLKESGFDHYEISNFARDPGLRSRHNQKYWSFAPYLGLGPSAHSFVEPERSWNRADLAAYVGRLESGRMPIGRQEILSREQMMIEAVYLGLRRAEGIRIEAFDKRFHMAFKTLFGRPLTALQRRGLVEIVDGSCRLTGRGMPLLDAVASELIAAV